MFGEREIKLINAFSAQKFKWISVHIVKFYSLGWTSRFFHLLPPLSSLKIIFNPLPQTYTHTHHTLHPLPMSLPRLHRPYGGDFSYQAAAVSHLWPRSDRPPWGFSRWLCSGPEPPSPLRSEYIPWLENTAWMRYRYRDPRQKCKGNRWFFNENLVRGNNAGRYSLFFPSLLVNFLLFFSERCLRSFYDPCVSFLSLSGQLPLSRSQAGDTAPLQHLKSRIRSVWSTAQKRHDGATAD